MAFAERLSAGFVASIEDSTIGKNHTCRNQHTVAVGMHAAVHTGSVVADDASNHGRTDGSRIGWEYTSVRLQDIIDP